MSILEPPKSFSIIRNKKPVEHGGQITVVDGKVETVTCESRKSNPAPELKWFLGEKMLTPSIQDNVTELNDTRRWRSYSTLEHIFTLDDFGKLLTCRVYHPAYENSPQETSVSLDLLCKISIYYLLLFNYQLLFLALHSFVIQFFKTFPFR